MKLSTSRLKMWAFRSGKVVLACLLALMLIPFMGTEQAVHAAASTWPVVGQSVQPSNVQTLLKVGGTMYAGTGNFGNDVWSNSNGTWTQMEGSPAYVRALLVEADGTLYAGAWGDGNNVSTYTVSDGWKQMSGSPSNVYSLIDVNGAIYAGTSNGSSNDVWTYTAVAGWTKMMGSPGNAQVLTYINGTLYVGTGSNGVWSNSNGSWTQISNGASNPKYVTSLLNVNGMLYAAGTPNGDNRSVWTYNNSNNTWTLISGAPAGVKTLRYANGTLYAGAASSYDDIWTYTVSDGWTRMSGSPAFVFSLLDDNGTLYAGTHTGSKDIWTYNNGVWTQRGAVPGRTNTLLSVNDTLYAGTDDNTNAVWAYTDSDGWRRMSGSPGYVYALIDVNGMLYAGTSNDDNDNDVWTYDTAAATPAWTQMTVSNAPSNVYALLNVNGMLYAGTNNGNNDIWTYDTTAATPEWTQMMTGTMPGYVNVLLNVDGTLYAGNAAGGNDVWTYDTTAATPEWTQMTTSNAPSFVTSLLHIDGTLYAGTGNGDNDVWTYDTTAAAPEWTQMTASHAPGSVSALVDANGTLYAGTGNDNNDVWFYSNGNWEQVSDSPNQLYTLLYANGNLYAAGLNGVNQLISPETPANLQSGSTTSASTTLSWDAVSGATGYYLYENGGNTAIATVTGVTYTVNGLTPSTSYTFTVSAFNAAGESAQSDEVPVQTLSTDAALTSTIGTVSTGGTAEESITDIPYATTLDGFKAAITPAENATFEVYDEDGTTVATTLATGKKVIVTAQDGTTKVTYTVIMNVSTDATLTSTIGTVSIGGTANESITNIPYATTLDELKTAITPAENATFEVYDADGTTVATTLATGKKVIVTAQDGTTKITYTVTMGLSTTATLTSSIGTVSTGGTANESITNIPYETTLDALKAAITPAENATFEVYDADGITVATALATGTKIIVTAQDGTTKVAYTVTVTDNVTVIPAYTVTYNSNGATSGNVPTDSGSYAQGVTASVYGNTGNLMKTGYTFAGWNTAANGSETSYAEGSPFIIGTSNVTLYAKWTINAYTVSFNSNGGSAVSSQPVIYNSTATKPTDPTRSGYTFGGWYSDGGLTALFNFTIPITADTTLYAKWTANSTGGSSSNGGTPPLTSSNNTVISTDGTLTLAIGKSGEVSLGDGVKIMIPADASSKELKVTIEKVADTQKLLTSKETLVSPVFEILKNFSENFNKEITLTFTFDPKGLKGNEKPSVFFYDEIKKVWVEVGGEVQGNTITIKINHFTKYAVLAASQGEDSTTVTQQPVNFSDISGHWAEASIKQAVSFGIVSGYPDGTFNPNRTVTRAEFAVMLMNALKPQGDGAELTFTDKGKIGIWAQKSVAQAVQAGIITGYEDSTFRPDAEITRSEMAAMIAKALGQSVEAATETGFADDKDILDWAKGAVGAMKKLGIIEGKGANVFAPSDKTTRAEAVTVLLKMLAQKDK